MTNVESMDYTHSHPSTIASLSNTTHFLSVSYTDHIPSSKQPPYLLMTHKYRGSIIVLSISKSVEPNEEQKEMISGFQQGILCKH